MYCLILSPLKQNCEDFDSIEVGGEQPHPHPISLGRVKLASDYTKNYNEIRYQTRVKLSLDKVTKRARRRIGPDVKPEG